MKGYKCAPCMTSSSTNLFSTARVTNSLYIIKNLPYSFLKTILFLGEKNLGLKLIEPDGGLVLQPLHYETFTHTYIHSTEQGLKKRKSEHYSEMGYSSVLNDSKPPTILHCL